VDIARTIGAVQQSRAGKVTALHSSAGRIRVASLAALLVMGIALADRWVGLNLSLGVLYVIPMSLLALVAPPQALVAAAILCAVLRISFDSPGSTLEAALRFVLALVAYCSVGLFVAAVRNNQRLAVEHLERIRHEHMLRVEVEEQLKALVEGSPAAVLTLDGRGIVLAANHSANSLFGLDADESIVGRPIEEHLPVLRDALRLDTGAEPFRTAAQSQGQRKNGTLFLADIWFSTYTGPNGKHLAAIVVDSSEEMREREERSLRQLSWGSRILACAVLHEVRNFCSAFSVLYSNLKRREGICRLEDLEGLDKLAHGLAEVSSLELHRKEPEALEPVPLQHVLNDLRIIIEPNWAEIDGRISWEVPDTLPRVLADPPGLLQVFLNVAQNSHRAVRHREIRELKISAVPAQKSLLIRFQDSGPGVQDPGALFHPFQRGAASTGLGLYLSRALLRSYGGDLRYEAGTGGASFVIEVPALVRGEGELAGR
jgi:two-component system sensor kinase FixL